MAESRREHEWEVASHVMVLLAEPNRDRKKRAAPFEPRDFNPFAPPPPPPPIASPQMLRALFSRPNAIDGE